MLACSRCLEAFGSSSLRRLYDQFDLDIPFSVNNLFIKNVHAYEQASSREHPCMHVHVFTYIHTCVRACVCVRTYV